jgi:hypothetical protein
MRWGTLLSLWLAVLPVAAHKPSDSYLTLRPEIAVVHGQWDIALRDLELAVGLDTNGDGEITWGELRGRHDAVAAYALSRLALSAGGAPCALRATDNLVDRHSDGAYAVLRFEADCAQPVRDLTVRYGLLFDLDPQHRGLLRLILSDSAATAIFSPEAPIREFRAARANHLAQFGEYLRSGVHHIWIGIDHVLFLLALLLPAVVARAGGPRDARSAFRPVFWDVFRIVTAFTLAHSITLSLAALGVIQLPSRLVESAIAASVLIAAANNLSATVTNGRWVVAFAFGLVHGFGFASVLADLGLPRETLVLALVGFNLGVEAGQLAIVAIFLPLAFLARNTLFYRRAVLIGGSVAIALVASIWLVERALDLKLFPD